MPCNLRVARQRATQQNAAVEGAVGIAQEEATDWGRGMAFQALTVAAIAAGLTAAAAQEGATARVRGEVAAAAQEARLAQEAIAFKEEAEVKALEEALAQERAKKEAEERAHAEATAKAQADAARKDAIEAARRKVAEERAKMEAELAALEAEMARLQRARDAEAAGARKEAERRAAAATAAAMEKAAAKLRRETPLGGSRVETLLKLFEGDASSEDDAGSVKVLPWVVVGAGGLGAGKTSGAGTRGVSLDVVIGCRTRHSDTNGGESSDNRSKVHADCGPAENPSL